MFETMVMDFAWTGLLLLIGGFLRAKVKIIQKLYIPAAVAGGFVGLLLGEDVLGQFSPVFIHWSENIQQYSVWLLAVLFSVQFFGVKLERKMLKRVSAVWLIATIVISVQVLGGIVTAKNAGLIEGFMLLPQAGFFGGHGTAEILAGVWQKMEYWQYREVSTLGSVFATMGLLFATVGGILLIKLAAHKKWLAAEGNMGELTKEERTGYIEVENRSRFMEKVVQEQAMDPLAFHVAMVFGMMLCAMGLLKVIHWCAARFYFMRAFGNLSIMVTALLVSLIFSRIAARTKLGQICDGASLKRIGGTALEFVITLSIATTDLDVIRRFGKPIILASVLGLLFTVVLCLGLSRLWIKSNWFEHGILMMGAYTGVLATGLMLIRIADPDMKTDGVTDVVAASPLWILTGQNFYLTIAPIMLVASGGFERIAGISGILTIGCLILGFWLYRGKE